MIRSITKPFTAEWCGRKATQWQYLTKSYSTCERVVAHLWADGELELKHCKRDGRYASFVVFDKRTIKIADPIDARIEADRYAVERLGNFEPLLAHGVK